MKLSKLFKTAAFSSLVLASSLSYSAIAVNFWLKADFFNGVMQKANIMTFECNGKALPDTLGDGSYGFGLSTSSLEMFVGPSPWHCEVNYHAFLKNKQPILLNDAASFDIVPDKDSPTIAHFENVEDHGLGKTPNYLYYYKPVNGNAVWSPHTFTIGLRNNTNLVINDSSASSK